MGKDKELATLQHQLKSKTFDWDEAQVSLTSSRQAAEEARRLQRETDRRLMEAESRVEHLKRKLSDMEANKKEIATENKQNKENFLAKIEDKDKELNEERKNRAQELEQDRSVKEKLTN